MRMYVLDESPSDLRRYLFRGKNGARLYENSPAKENEKIFEKYSRVSES